MDIRDVVHGVIQIESHELPIIDSHYFQRLRQIKQTGFAENSYPGSTHNRFIHSLGALRTITDTFESIFSGLKTKSPETFRRFRALSRFSALLHDIGHGPLSHTTEFAMPDVSKLQVPGYKKNLHRKANHEDYTLKILLDSSLTPLLEEATRPFGFKPIHIAATIESSMEVDDDFFSATVEGETLNFRPILHQLISSELDADRMDYLRRDSFYCGVSYGVFDYSWLVANLDVHVKDKTCYLALKHRALYSFEDFLLSRFNMFLMVYSHYKTVMFDEMLAKYLNDPECDYKLPADIEAYGQCTDSHLYAHLRKSNDPWAHRIVERQGLSMLLETHSGIPSTEKAHEQQQKLFKKTCEELNHKGIEFITNISTSILSKYFGPQYFGKPDHPIFVRYDNLLSAESFIPLQKCTSLFTQYPNSRSISRIFVKPEDYSKIRKNGRSEQLLFE
jgi:HD superfamily phosphohydrolase